MINILGIRHHGPGSARSVLAALNALRPERVLVEGPPEASAALALLAHPEARPPLALLVYARDEPARASFYPLAEFSPEYQAIRWALQHAVPVEFFDLPAGLSFGLERAPEAPTIEAVDPLTLLARAAGYADGERWWEHLVESQANAIGVFDAILDAMRAARAEAPDAHAWMRNDLREAHMRTRMRAARKSGAARMAVVCGAWHAPALDLDAHDARADAALLKPLTGVPVAVAWTPWTHARLARDSGYGAGVASPGWYAHLWKHGARPPDQVIARWLVKTARLLRGKDIDASSASIIEAARLAGTLAAMRGRQLPDLDELDDAVRSVLCGGDDGPMALIALELTIGRAMGAVPPDAPATPLQQDLAAEQKRLRLKPTAEARPLELDLRNATDLERSRLLHRTRALGLAWGEPAGATGRGTFKEAWSLKWQPEFALTLIERAQHGNTVAAAASALLTAQAADAALPRLGELLDAAMLAALDDAVAAVMAWLQARSATEADVGALLEALPALARTARYGDVRNADVSQALGVLRGIGLRACIGLPAACVSLDDDAAAQMLARITAAHAAFALADDPELGGAWREAQRALADQRGLHGLIAGRCVRMLRDAGALDDGAARDRLGFALSPAADPAPAAAWLEGFLGESGQVLLLDDALWRVVDDWVRALAPDAFVAALPLVRRTFARFAWPERRQMRDRALAGAAPVAAPAAHALDDARVAQALPVLLAILGLGKDGPAQQP